MKVMGIIFSNDGELGDLTDKRTTASLPFGGRYRFVDFALSNLSSAGVRHVGVVARYNFQSLMNHIGDGEEWGLELGEGDLEYLTPYASSSVHNYRGKLESLASSMDFLECGGNQEYVVMIDSSILCNIDLNKVVASHIASGRDLTVVTKAGIANGEKQLDLAIRLDSRGEVEDMVVDYAAPEGYLASVDIFVASKPWLIDRVKELIAHNRFHMDRDLVLGGWQRSRVSLNVFPFEGTVLYNDSPAEYFANSLKLIEKDVRHDLFGRAHSVYTKVRDRVPTYYGDGCEVAGCIVADGCMLDGNVKNSVLFRQVDIQPGAEVENCVIMNDSVIGAGAQLKNVILDKEVTVTPGARLIGTPQNPILIKRGETV